MIEIRFHGRFGQPVGKLARAVGQYALKQGKHVQIFDSFAAVRPGAPMYSVIRVAEGFIRERSVNNTRPDIVIVLDNSLFAAVDVTKGLNQGGVVMALEADNARLEDIEKTYRFTRLDPYFTRGSAVEVNVISALESQGVF
ncbi:MAG: 2-oxoacid:acceptor oxidoreductase family protein [Desulfitobacteriaceae bacterium]